MVWQRGASAGVAGRMCGVVMGAWCEVADALGDSVTPITSSIQHSTLFLGAEGLERTSQQAFDALGFGSVGSRIARCSNLRRGLAKYQVVIISSAESIHAPGSNYAGSHSPRKAIDQACDNVCQFAQIRIRLEGS